MANPRHYALGNHAPALLRRFPAAVRHCAAWLATTLWHCTTHSRTAGAPPPRKKDGGTLEEKTHAYSSPARDGAVTSGQ
jgi:hypothetical protein